MTQPLLDITIMLATYNRAEVLRKTLASMAAMDRNGLTIDIVIVDNNSNDATQQVVESFTDQLPITYFFQPRPGKNCALNMALDQVELGELVVFTDDDVKVQTDWLQAIVAVSQRHPEYSVFGGKINPEWPYDNRPRWTENKYFQGWALALHDYADSETPYTEQDDPFGPNFWVRRDLFANGRRFNEQVGPRPGHFIMGSELSFLRTLRDDGYKSLYAPQAVVGHYIQESQLVPQRIRNRAYRYGRSLAHFQELARRTLYETSSLIWYVLYLALFLVALLRLIVASLHFNSDTRLENTSLRLIQFGYIRETLCQAGTKKETPCSTPT